MVQSGGGYNNITIYEDNLSLLSRNKIVVDYLSITVDDYTLLSLRFVIQTSLP